MERGLPKDRILALDLAALRATFESQLREHAEGRAATLRWLPGPYNLSDGLTKYIAVQSFIISVLSEGKYTLADEATLLTQAEHTKRQLKTPNVVPGSNRSSRDSAVCLVSNHQRWQ